MWSTTQFALADYPGFLPGLAVSVVLATLVHRPVARWLSAPHGVAWLLILSLGAITAATLTPGAESSTSNAGPGCDLDRIGPARWADYLMISETSLNVVLFVPLGVAIGLLPASPAKLTILGAAFALPVAIETIQLVAGPLGRACEAADVFDNVIGVALGLCGTALLSGIRNV